MSEEIELDHYSLRILEALQVDAHLTVQQLSERVGLSPTPCWKRIKAMEAAGVIRGYAALVDPDKVGLGLRVVVEANLGQHSEDLVRRCQEAVAASCRDKSSSLSSSRIGGTRWASARRSAVMPSSG